ncbi:hypothetical protein C4552_03280 [Candidatus Parcubacteria bacterium]|nr:MAG: hypothetical protein C4552_03280 [Candidatus Parcubacteria bacterium]
MVIRSKHAVSRYQEEEEVVKAKAVSLPEIYVEILQFARRSPERMRSELVLFVIAAGCTLQDRSGAWAPPLNAERELVDFWQNKILPQIDRHALSPDGARRTILELMRRLIEVLEDLDRGARIASATAGNGAHALT